jgi:hypothetical protein
MIVEFLLACVVLAFLVLLLKDDNDASTGVDTGADEEQRGAQRERVRERVREKERERWREEEREIEKEIEKERERDAEIDAVYEEQRKAFYEEQRKAFYEEVDRLASETRNNWLYCGDEGDTCNQAGRVRYGKGTKWFEKQSTGTIKCNNASFGGDPAGGAIKKCYFYANTPLVANTTARCGPQNNNKRCITNQYCSSSGWCSGVASTHRYKPYGMYSGPETSFYN